MQELDQQKLVDIATQISKCLHCSSGRITLNSKFKLCIEKECNENVFPLTKAAVLACDCELPDMTDPQIRSIKQAMLKDVEPIIELAKLSCQEVKFTAADAPWERLSLKPSDTSPSRAVLDKVREEAEEKFCLLNQRIRIVRNWCFFFDLFKMEDEEEESSATTTTAQPKTKRAKIGK